MREARKQGTSHKQFEWKLTADGKSTWINKSSDGPASRNATDRSQPRATPSEENNATCKRQCPPAETERSWPTPRDNPSADRASGKTCKVWHNKESGEDSRKAG